MPCEVVFHSDLDRVDWEELTAALKRDDFDNGRSPEQLRRSFANSAFYCFASDGERTVGKLRVLSDGVCNAYLVDVWTLSEFRRRGIATEMIRRVLERLPGQHVYLQADEHNLVFYERLGFRPQPHGLSLVVGTWLRRN